MIAASPSSSETRADGADAQAAYRRDVLRLLSRLGLEPAQAIALLEANTGRQFETCSPSQLVPLLQELLALLESHRSPVEATELEL
jgi:hypothetical protein